MSVGVILKSFRVKLGVFPVHWNVKDFPEIGGGSGVTIDNESFGVGAAGISHRILEGNIVRVAKVKARRS